VINAIVAREKLMPTVVSPGLAVPHARLSNVNSLLVALGTSQKGIDFKAPGMEPVHVVILILTPKHDPATHLQVLAALANDFKDPEIPQQVAAMGDPADVLDFFSGTKVEIPQYLQAKDVMNTKPAVLYESDSLEKTIETFATKQVLDIPIIDEEDDIRGIVSLEDILRFSMPEHLLWMDDLSPIMHFQPFAEMLKSDTETKIADFMREDFTSVEENIPAIQLAKILMMEKLRQIIVTRNDKLVGVVNLSGFSTKLFWS